MAEPPLTDLQRALLELFFSLPESAGFVLAGGAALVATGLTERPTQDVDLFGGDPAAGITTAANALEAACSDRGWTSERIRDTTTFRRVVVHALSERFDLDRLLDLAAQLDLGFDTAVLVDMLASHRRFTDEDSAELGGDPSQLRAFVDRWRSELATRES